ncbi:hypothetical protein K1719_017592 [Acacia pycnantha]|nr:hypothetical protein K1719_017592 [Acacia pycnantha]
MKKLICLVLLLAIVAIAGVEAHGYGECGKFSPDRMLTHVLRHCAKPARDLTAPVTPNCCEPLSQVSEECFYAIINSDTWNQRWRLKEDVADNGEGGKDGGDGKELMRNGGGENLSSFLVRPSLSQLCLYSETLQVEGVEVMAMRL